jgi:hypothetical protein
VVDPPRERFLRESVTAAVRVMLKEGQEAQQQLLELLRVDNALQALPEADEIIFINSTTAVPAGLLKGSNTHVRHCSAKDNHSTGQINRVDHNTSSSLTIDAHASLVHITPRPHSLSNPSNTGHPFKECSRVLGALQYYSFTALGRYPVIVQCFAVQGVWH